MYKIFRIIRGDIVKEKILKAIKTYIRQHGYPPTLREIGDMVGLQSTSSVHAQIQKMMELGMLETDHPGMPRALRVPGMAAGYELEGARRTSHE
jgi:SOS-response transcriptional repressor LexA